MNPYQEFCEYFQELDRQGLPYGLSEMLSKATELKLKPPKDVFN